MAGPTRTASLQAQVLSGGSSSERGRHFFACMAAAVACPGLMYIHRGSRSSTQAKLRLRRRLLPRVAMAADVATATAPAASKSGILLLEHLNLNVMDRDVAEAFYEALGCVADPTRPKNKTLHLHCGALTQFHTPAPNNEVYIAEEGAQRWRGEVELLYADDSSLQAAVERLRKLPFKADVSDPANGETRVSCPYGGEYILRTTEASRSGKMAPSASADGTVLRRPNSEASTCIGMGSVTMRVPSGTAAAAADFYNTLLGCGTKQVSDGCWDVMAGPGGDSQHLRLVEAADAVTEDTGEHVAIYVGDYEGCFNRLLEQNLIYVNPRFVHLDKSTTLEEALDYKTFRFRDVVDLATGKVLFQLEHEVRTTMHKSCPPLLKLAP
eukprot:TRINITY_DN40070_c0_g1_i1.p1 TRINITY_DN40070_c0_g1~~TRINITY_DN40070_c0_g1_i1.p1  ORF type:complete len:429 (+),score=77.03 TRINITY_DN40070_c0_g1_i1:143-1288(+)